MRMTLTEEQKLQADPKINLKYEVLSSIGEGCFGSIFKVRNRITTKYMALKIQYCDHVSLPKKKRSNLVSQIMIMEKLRNVSGVPRMENAGKWSQGYFMEIELLASSLYEEKAKQFNEIEINKMAAELLIVLRGIHEKGVIHQDLKPQNIMRDSFGGLYIIDFGLSILETEINNSENANKMHGFVGTPRYASLAAHYGNVQTPKDDIQSLLYVLGSLYLKKAPWFQLKGPESKKLQKIQKYKQLNSEAWFRQCGQPFLTTYEYLKKLTSRQKIDYSYLISLFQYARKRNLTKTQIINYLQIQHPTYTRRHSEAYQFAKTPTINIHFVDVIRKNQQDKDYKYRVDEEDRENQQSKGKQNSGTSGTGTIENKIFSSKQDENVSSSKNNFSEMAQDGYIELIQFLTDKIFKSFEEKDKQNIDNVNSRKQIITSCKTSSTSKDKSQKQIDSTMIKSNYSNQPKINKLTKYQGLHFKNPFES